MPNLQPCPGCGCEIDSGLLWFAGPGLARICCNKRCASRAQKRHEALATGKARGRKSMPLLPLADEPVEAERGWSSLNQDVIAQVAARLGLRDCLAAALTCKHWRAHITRGSTHMALRIDDTTPEGSRRVPLGRCACCGGGHSVLKCKCSKRAETIIDITAPSSATSAAVCHDSAASSSGSSDSAAQLLDSARRLMPHVEHLSVSVYSRCRQHDYLLKHMRALSRWGGLTSLDISWELAPDPTALLRAAHSTRNSSSDSDSDSSEIEPDAAGSNSCGGGSAAATTAATTGASRGGARRRSAIRRARHAPKPPPPPGPLPRCVVGDMQRLGSAALAALGLLPSLTRLSITAAYAVCHIGLPGLSGLSRLTELELRRAPRDGVEVADWLVLPAEEQRRERNFGRRYGYHVEPWCANEADLGALSSLRVLRVHCDLLSPPALGALGPHLTRLELERLSLFRYSGLAQGSYMSWGIEDLAPQLVKCKRLRYLSLTIAWDPLDTDMFYALDASGMLDIVVRELAQLTREQVQARAEFESRRLERRQQQPQQQLAGDDGGGSVGGDGRRRGRGRRQPAGHQAQASDKEGEAECEDTPPAEPVEVVLDLTTHYRPLGVQYMSCSALAALQRHHQGRAQLLQVQRQWQWPSRRVQEQEQEPREEEQPQTAGSPDPAAAGSADSASTSDGVCGDSARSTEDAAIAAGAPTVATAAAAAAHQPAGHAVPCDPDLPPSFFLSHDFFPELVGLKGLSHLAINFHAGATQQLHTLSELTRLTHLAMRFGPAMRIDLDAWDMQRLCAALGPRLTHLELELPASCLGADVCESVRLLTALRTLRLTAGGHVRQVALTRRELRRALARAAPSWHGDVKVERPSPELVAEVKAAQTPLLFLQQLFAAMEDSAAVLQTLQAEAEWRAAQQQAAAGGEAAAAAAGVGGAAGVEAEAGAGAAEVDAAELAPEAPAAAAPADNPDADQDHDDHHHQQQQDLEPPGLVAAPQEGGGGAPEAAAAAGPDDEGAAAGAGHGADAGVGGGGVGQDAAVAAGGGGAAAAAGLDMPFLPEWVMRWSRGEPRTPGPSMDADQGGGSATGDDTTALPQPTPLHQLSVQELDQLRKAMSREELVTAPAFQLGSWAPRRLQRLWLRGFGGLEVPAAAAAAASAMSGGLVGGGAGLSAGFVGPGGTRVARAPVTVLPHLEEVDVVMHGRHEAAAAEARQALVAWRDAGGAPALCTVVVESAPVLL
ncbi:hypothetical protein HYH02_004107 [Chlamydomonas schloesseri]|uniref:F-box domain-containing protein n=1 Tax=Chlamydomonas schloesseri TaxID=2026947 RepID=A0A836B9T7_9CHLO|nr:hypothetical protein HYH02_004107 [Chlamydomonas schloesseri]|eukprot:KAG2451509.1 hypothetical protein HYH02_004107 [Chlamydomonas schloesseri]